MPTYGRVTEAEVSWAVLQILAKTQSGEATIQSLIEQLPQYLNFSAGDLEESDTRRGEHKWEQIVRNITSHQKTPGNYIHDGYLVSIPKGLKITDLGRGKTTR